jgi:hypothetical protein
MDNPVGCLHCDASARNREAAVLVTTIEGILNIEQGISNEEGKKEKTTDPRVLPRGRNG